MYRFNSTTKKLIKGIDTDGTDLEIMMHIIENYDRITGKTFASELVKTDSMFGGLCEVDLLDLILESTYTLFGIDEEHIHDAFYLVKHNKEAIQKYI